MHAIIRALHSFSVPSSKRRYHWDQQSFVNSHVELKNSGVSLGSLMVSSGHVWMKAYFVDLTTTIIYRFFLPRYISRDGIVFIHDITDETLEDTNKIMNNVRLPGVLQDWSDSDP